MLSEHRQGLKVRIAMQALEERRRRATAEAITGVVACRGVSQSFIYEAPDCSEAWEEICKNTTDFEVVRVITPGDLR